MDRRRRVLVLDRLAAAYKSVTKPSQGNADIQIGVTLPWLAAHDKVFALVERRDIPEISLIIISPHTVDSNHQMTDDTEVFRLLPGTLPDLLPYTRLMSEEL